jgi:hypothetical protein
MSESRICFASAIGPARTGTASMRGPRRVAGPDGGGSFFDVQGGFQ